MPNSGQKSGSSARAEIDLPPNRESPILRRFLRTRGDRPNTAYTNPDYVLEHYYTGRIEKFAGNDGADKYRGLMPLSELREYTRQHLRLPGITDEASGIFARADIVLEKLEELTLYVLELDERVGRLEHAG